MSRTAILEEPVVECNCLECREIIHEVADELRAKEERRSKEEQLYSLREDSSVQGHIKRKQLIEELYGVTIQ